MRNEGSPLAHIFFPESEHMKSAEEFKEIVETIDNPLHYPELNAEKVSEFYLEGVDTNSTEALKLAFYDFFGDLIITCPTYHFAKQFAQSSPKRDALFYEWTYPSKLIQSTVGCTKDMGVCHASELEYVFGFSLMMNETDRQFSEDVMKMWTNFAKNG